MATVERVTITPMESSSLLTKLVKECWIDSSIFGFRSAIKKFGVDRYKKNCGPATEGFNIRAGQEWHWTIQNQENIPRRLNSYVKLNSKADFFSSIF